MPTLHDDPPRPVPALPCSALFFLFRPCTRRSVPFNSSPGLVKGPWSGEEDENLVALMAKGFSGWTELAANTRRTAKQVR